MDADNLLLLVVGADLRAELGDRPLATRLREAILQWQNANECDAPLLPVICTDVWYLNTTDLMSRPTISLGDPGVNAATAYLTPHLPTAFVMEHTLRIHMDPELVDARACLWGASAGATASAVEIFTRRHLDDFLRAAHEMRAAA